MKQIQVFLFMLFLSAFPSFLKAQLNIGPEVSMPVQGFEENAYGGAGVGILMEVPIIKNLELVGHLGFVHWTFREESPEYLRLSMASIQAGLRYNITPKFYLQGFAGGYTAFLKTKIYGIQVRGTQNDYGWAIGTGILANQNFDLSARLQFVDELRFLVIQGHFRIGKMMLDKK